MRRVWATCLPIQVQVDIMFGRQVYIMACYLCAVDGSPASAGPNNIALCKWVSQDPSADEQKGVIWRKRNEERGGGGRESSPSGAEFDQESLEQGVVS